VSSAENSGDAGDNDDDDTVVGLFLETNTVRPEWCRAKTEDDKRAQRRARKVQEQIVV
jgi:hypothetical protein